jgi:hypothetical protein
MSSIGPNEDTTSDEPHIERWSKARRLAFLLLATLVSWGLVLGAVYLWRRLGR